MKSSTANLIRGVASLAATAIIVLAGMGISSATGSVLARDGADPVGSLTGASDAIGADAAGGGARSVPAREIAPAPALSQQEQTDLLEAFYIRPLPGADESQQLNYANCRLLVERELVETLIPEGAEWSDYWLEPNGTRVTAAEFEDESGESTPIVEIEENADRIVLAQYTEDGSVVRSEVDQATVAEAIARCDDPDEALGIVLDSPLADLASVYREFLPNDDGTLTAKLVVQSSPYSEPYEDEFNGTIPSAGYDAFLDRMPEAIREQVEEAVQFEVDSQSN